MNADDELHPLAPEQIKSMDYFMEQTLDIVWWKHELSCGCDHIIQCTHHYALVWNKVAEGRDFIRKQAEICLNDGIFVYNRKTDKIIKP